MSTASEEAPPRELVVDAKPAPGDASDGGGAAMLPFVVTVGVGGLLAKFVSPVAGLVGFVACVAVVILLRKPREGRFVLRVEDGVLEVTRERSSGPPTKIALTQLLDVTLESKAHNAGGRGVGAAARVRLALERSPPDEPIFVPDERVTPIEAQEWQSKVRVFLRKHGWVPQD